MNVEMTVTYGQGFLPTLPMFANMGLAKINVTPDKIVKLQGGKIKKQEVMETFKQWYVANVGRGTIKGKELYDFMDKRYGAYKKGGWNNVAIVYDEADGEPDVE